MAALARFIRGIIDPEVAETVAAWHTVVQGCELGIRRLIIEGDSIWVVAALRKEGPCWSGNGQLIDDTKHCLSTLSYASVQHVKRDANKVAHVLAKYALSQFLDKTWVEVCLSIIHNIVIVEQSADS